MEEGFEVVHMPEHISEYCVHRLKKSNGKRLVLVTKERLELPEGEEGKTVMEESDAKFENFCNFMKEILDKKVEKVTLSHRLLPSLCCSMTSTCGWTVKVEQITKARHFKTIPSWAS